MGSLRGENTPRSLYLSGIGAIYVCAFVSFWLQYPGLLGARGLLPAADFWRKVAPEYGAASPSESFWKLPCLLWWVDASDGAAVDAACEAIAAGGAVLGAAAVFGVHHAALFAAAFLAYLTLFTVGQTWLGFQWDIFLLETGFLTVLYAPLFSLSSRGEPSQGHPATWPLRLLWVKFMVMSGVVKVTADCPTWQNLSALEYHFASTCLPTAEAWWFHSLPPPLLRLGTAFMFLCELVAPWLLLAPITPMRRVGVLVQIPLQVGIQYSGNYNWFNFHTAILLLPAWDADFPPSHPWERFWARAGAGRAARLAAVAALGHAFWRLFPVRWTPPLATVLSRPDGLAVGNLANRRFVDGVLGAALAPGPIAAVYGFAALAACAYAVRPPFAGARFRARAAAFLWRSGLAAVGALACGVVLLPCRSLTHQDVLPLLPGPLRAPTAAAAALAEPFRASSSYGLFRRMTGVGGASRPGFGGLPAANVEVPAVVVEGSRDGDAWAEIPFRYAPFGERRAPRRTAPHQPRLDWQMWFAALGSYHQQPWLLHLLYKVLTATPATDPALALLDVDAYPFADGPPAFARASLYHYDFTRAAAPWADADAALPADCALFSRGAGACGKYWTRTKKLEYVPRVDAAILRDQVVAPQGWPTDAAPAPAGAAARVRAFVGWYPTILGSPAFVDGPAVFAAVCAGAPALLAALLLRPRKKKTKKKEEGLRPKSPTLKRD